MMKTGLAVATLAVALSPLAAHSVAAAPMSASDLLKPESLVEQTACYRYCAHYRWVYRHYKKYRVCTVWKTRCSYGRKHYRRHYRRYH